ncbi:PD-(D/E)XK motif protein [Flavobacterium johnsoniae]|uniref:PD-(D/E)XK motif protein n=1 Tax=Flavobacterium johnsoniae TaxID=986 RepID=UPI0011F04DE4|nr:PD-(D/E)XK motif protein [Flavobacterium johnsoniae]
MSLIDVFLEIEIPQTENLKLFNATALSDFPFAKIGVNYLGFPVVLISSKFDQIHLSQKNIKLKYIELTHNLECKVSENGKSKIDNYSVIIFKSNEETFQNYFLGIAQSLLNSLSKKPTQKEVYETFKNFVEIFRSLTGMPTKTIQGLWAELILIEQSKNPGTLINYWHNIPEEKFDFNADDEKIEVKSSSNLERVHIFTAEQLNPTIDSQLIIASIFTKQVSNGLNILDLLNKIDKRIIEIELKEKIFRIVSKTLGDTFEQSTKIKYDYDLAKKSLRFYRHQDISKVERVNIPERVSEVKFKSDLTNIKPIDLTKILSNGQLFKDT